MSLLDRVPPARPDEDRAPRLPRSADATTILAIFVTLQFVLPPGLVIDHLPMSMTAASAVALGLGVLWLCAHLTTTLGAAKGRSPVRSALFVYAFVLLASYGFAASRYLPGDERANSDHAMVTLFSLIIVALAVCDGVRSRARLYFLLRVMAVCATGVAVVGIVQYLFGYDLTLLVRPPGLQFEGTDPVLAERFGLPRVAGTTAHPIEFGVFCAMTLPLVTHLAWTSGQGRRSHIWWVCVGLIAIGLMFSVSRSAILAVTAAVIVLFCGWSARQRVRMLVAGAAFLVVVQLISPGLLRTFANMFRNVGSDDSVRWRTHDYETAQELILEHPLLGRGLGTWFPPKHPVFDNQFLLTLVDIGVLGLAAFLGLLATAVYSALRVMWFCHQNAETLTTAETDKDLGLCLMASICAIVPTYATFDFSAFATVSSLCFLLVGICGALLRIVGAEAAGEPIDEHAVL